MTQQLDSTVGLVLVGHYLAYPRLRNRASSFSESESGSVVNDERVENALMSLRVPFSAEPGGSGLAALLGILCRRRSGTRALRELFLHWQCGAFCVVTPPL